MQHSLAGHLFDLLQNGHRRQHDGHAGGSVAGIGAQYAGDQAHGRFGLLDVGPVFDAVVDGPSFAEERDAELGFAHRLLGRSFVRHKAGREELGMLFEKKTHNYC